MAMGQVLRLRSPRRARQRFPSALRLNRYEKLPSPPALFSAFKLIRVWIRPSDAVCLNGRSWTLRREGAAVQMKIGVIGLMLHPLAPHVFVIFHYASASASGRHETLFQWDFSSHIQSRAAVPLEQRQLQGWRCGCASICAARASYDRATRHSIAASTNTAKKKKTCRDSFARGWFPAQLQCFRTLAIIWDCHLDT